MPLCIRTHIFQYLFKALLGVLVWQTPFGMLNVPLFPLTISLLCDLRREEVVIKKYTP
jgi:hypothetical protein